MATHLSQSHRLLPPPVPSDPRTVAGEPAAGGRDSSRDCSWRRVQATLRALPRSRYASALVLADTHDLLVALLAQRCARLQMISHPAQLGSGEPGLREPGLRERGLCEPGRPATADTAGEYDLILIGGVLDALDRTARDRLADFVRARLYPGGHCLLVQPRAPGGIDGADAAAHSVACFIDASAPLRLMFAERRPGFRLDLLHQPAQPGQGVGAIPPAP